MASLTAFPTFMHGTRKDCTAMGVPPHRHALPTSRRVVGKTAFDKSITRRKSELGHLLSSKALVSSSRREAVSVGATRVEADVSTFRNVMA